LEVGVMYLSTAERSARRPEAARARPGLSYVTCSETRFQTSRLAVRDGRRVKRVGIADGAGGARCAALRTSGERHDHVVDENSLMISAASRHLATQ